MTESRRTLPRRPGSPRAISASLRAASVFALLLVAPVVGQDQPSQGQPSQDDNGKQNNPASQGQTEPVLKTSIGMRGVLHEIVLPGTQLRAKPVEDPQKADLIVRILNSYKHGDAYRYNLEVTPFVAGSLDLRPALERVDGSTTDNLPPLIVESRALLASERIEPNALDPRPPRTKSYYTALWIVGGVLWGIGLLAILFVGRHRRIPVGEVDQRTAPTLADRLRPLVVQARDGSLDDHGRAEIERLLMAHWRRRLNLMHVPPGQAFARLRADDEAGALLRQLEDWLHRPASDEHGHDAEIASLLAPYENVSYDPTSESTNPDAEAKPA